ncbi:venom serine protease Bi-VSP-like [Schistocerca nitens]|uniref:venom serine protease Bi-VSP-like n=1 Tax=Schistocerca nitens TaxID=7011 RepID=UPI00211972DB|nr:venom serine protease Bi-VSP-like [Schistocerca nitens]
MAVRVLYLLVSALLVVMAKPSITKLDAWTPRKQAHDRIVDGLPAGVGQFTHQALVLADEKKICAGSLITRTAVLTAAHNVVKYSKWTVRLGGIYRNQDESTAWIVVSSWAQVHPEFNTSSYYSYDVAVIFLPEEAPLNSYINLVALPSFLEVNESFVGQRAQVSGWGYINGSEPCCPQNLLWTEVTVVPNTVCSEFYSAGYITESTLCAGNDYNGICAGDTGTALVLKTDGGFKQIGIASYLTKDFCGAAGVPGAYTRVTSVLDWITKTAQISV